MIYRAAELEEIVGDLMDAVDDARAAGARLGAEAARAREENRRMRAALCTILAATQRGSEDGDLSGGGLADIERMVADALGETPPGAGEA